MNTILKHTKQSGGSLVTGFRKRNQFECCAISRNYLCIDEAATGSLTTMRCQEITMVTMRRQEITTGSVLGWGSCGLYEQFEEVLCDIKKLLEELSDVKKLLWDAKKLIMWDDSILSW